MRTNSLRSPHSEHWVPVVSLMFSKGATKSGGGEAWCGWYDTSGITVHCLHAHTRPVLYSQVLSERKNVDLLGVISLCQVEQCRRASRPLHSSPVQKLRLQNFVPVQNCPENHSEPLTLPLMQACVRRGQLHSLQRSTRSSCPSCLKLKLGGFSMIGWRAYRRHLCMHMAIRIPSNVCQVHEHTHADEGSSLHNKCVTLTGTLKAAKAWT